MSRYLVRCFARDGTLRWQRDAFNLITTLGKNALLDAALAGAGYTATVYLGLIASTGFSAGPQATDTMASHAGWVEAGGATGPAYTGNRKTVSWNAASGGNKSIVTAQFTMSAAGSVRGCFLVFGAGASATKDSTGGVLFSAALFAAPEVVNIDDLLDVTYQVSTQPDAPAATPEDDFIFRRNSPYVVRWNGFNTAAELGPQILGGDWHTQPWSWSPGTFNGPVLDAGVKASGASSMLFDIPSFSGSSGQWQARYSDDNLTQVGAGQSLRVQVRVRVNDAFLNTFHYANIGSVTVQAVPEYVGPYQFRLPGNWTSGGSQDGTPDPYQVMGVGARVRTANTGTNTHIFSRVEAVSYNAGENKTYVTVTQDGGAIDSGINLVERIGQDSGWKIFDVGTGYNVTGNAAFWTRYQTNDPGSSSDTKLVVQSNGQRRYPIMYTGEIGSSWAGPNAGLVETSGGDFKLENGMPTPFCLYSQSGGALLSQPGCFNWSPNEFMTFQLCVDVYARRPDLAQNAWDARVRLLAAREGQPSVTVIDWNPGPPYNSDPQTPGYFPIAAGSLASDQKIGKLTLFPYMYAKDARQGHPLAKVWYDELIIAVGPVGQVPDIPDPAVQQAPTFPSWRQAMQPYTLADITADGRDMSDAFQEAGYNLAGWEGDKGDTYYNPTAWGAGLLLPSLGAWGSMVLGSNGHEQVPASTLHRFDLATASWAAPIGPPQLHRRVAPSYPAPPADAEIWYDPGNTSGLPTYTKDTIITASPVATPFHINPYSYAHHPPAFGLRYNTNVIASMRYDNMCAIPPNQGGESAGSIAFWPNQLVHLWGAGEAGMAQNNRHVRRFGCSSESWLPMSTNHTGNAAAFALPRSIICQSAFSAKHGRVFVAGNQAVSGTPDDFGAYNPATNALEGKRFTVQYAAYVEETNAIVTEGWDYELWVAFGYSRGTGPGHGCLFVADLDEVMAGIAGSPVPPSGIPGSWAILNAGSSAANSSLRRVALLTPAIDFSTANHWSMGWSKSHKALVMFKAPVASTNARNSVMPIPGTMIYIVTPPVGATNGVPNWQTQPWAVSNPTITLAGSTPGVRVGPSSAPKFYKRFSWSEALDCAILCGAPETMSVQALRLW